MNFGFNVEIKLGGAFGDNEKPVILNNVTEIHYHYPSPVAPSVAFESDIHGTGQTYRIDDVVEFEAKLAERKEESF